MKLNARITGTALLAASLLAVAPLAALAQEPSVFVRLYYSSWMDGSVDKSPADPAGAFSDSEGLNQNPTAGLETIFLHRLGVSYVRQKLKRVYADGAGTVPGCVAPVQPCEIDERATLQSLNLTVYAFPMAHGQFNAFAGGGAGYMDYNYDVDGVRQDQGELYKSLSMGRWFGGLEYTFERIGFRIEVSKSSAHKTVAGQSAEIDALFRYLTLVIPLN